MNGTTSVKVRAAASQDAVIDFRLDSPTGQSVGSVHLSSTGGPDAWTTKSAAVQSVSDAHTLYVVFTGSVNLNWFQFSFDNIQNSFDYLAMYGGFERGTLEGWQETYRTLHMWTQMVGKVRLALAPLTNHWWNVTQYVTARGLTTSAIPFGPRSFEIAFDFVDHVLRIETSDGERRELPLVPQSVARFYESFVAALRSLAIDVHIWPVPCEVEEPVRFTRDTRGAYDADAAHRFWRVLAGADAVMHEFRACFIGKCSPVHFFWGSFDLAVTRFSGRPAPPKPDADSITREGYSHECCSAGFWPGGGVIEGPAFYSYTAPAPAGLEDARIRPAEAAYNPELGQFIYMYDDLRRASDPRRALLEFLQTTYEAGANLGKWDRQALERQPPPRWS